MNSKEPQDYGLDGQNVEDNETQTQEQSESSHSADINTKVNSSKREYMGSD